MDKTYEAEYWVPEQVREYLRSLGFVLPLESMEGYIRAWHEWMSATGDFYDYRDTDGFGRIYEVHRRSIHPAMRVFGVMLRTPPYWHCEIPAEGFRR